MPVHDWTRVEAGIFHDFHHAWIEENKRALNRKLRNTDYYALAEQITGGMGPDVLTLQRPMPNPNPRTPSNREPSSIALAEAPPKMRFRIKDENKWYALKKKSVTIRHVSGHRVIAVLEILSPGNKSGRGALGDLVRKVRDLLAAGIHVGLVDLFPPTARDPEGVHPLIWDQDASGIFHFDAEQPLTCASYIGGPESEAFVEPLAVGGELPTLALFLTPEEYVGVPLEETYQAAFHEVPEFWQQALIEQQ